MSLGEVLTALNSFSSNELDAVRDRIEALSCATDPEEVAFIEEGLRSSREERSYTLEEVQEEMKTWRLDSK